MMYYRENENKEKITEKKYSASNVILNIKNVTNDQLSSRLDVLKNTDHEKSKFRFN